MCVWNAQEGRGIYAKWFVGRTFALLDAQEGGILILCKVVCRKEFLLYANRHRSILGAVSHILLAPAN
jgi:hypothetical protein